MRSFSKINMLHITLNLLELTGEDRVVAPRKLILYRIFNHIVLIMVLIDVLINFLYIEIDYYVKTLQSVFYLLQLLLKYFLLITQKSTIYNVLNIVLNKFWDYRDFGQHFIRRTETIYMRVSQIQAVMIAASVVLLYMYLLKSVVISNAGLIVESYIPKSEMMDAIMLISQTYYAWLSLTIVVGYDLIYFTACIHVVLQLRLLKEKIKRALNKQKSNTKLIICHCVKHHQILLSLFSTMRDLYSIMLLFHYLSTLTSTCIGFLQLILRNTGSINYAVEILALLFLIAQFAMYSFPAEQIAFEFSDIANAVYATKWYRNDIKTQKLILYIMMKSQQNQYFSGAGFVDINFEAFESVVRKSFSLCAIFRNLLNN